MALCPELAMHTYRGNFFVKQPHWVTVKMIRVNVFAPQKKTTCHPSKTKNLQLQKIE